MTIENLTPVSPLNECSVCAETFFTETLILDATETRYCVDCFAGEATAYAEYKAEATFGR